MSSTTNARTRRPFSTSPLTEPMSTDQFLAYLSTHPATARLARRLGALVGSTP